MIKNGKNFPDSKQDAKWAKLRVNKSLFEFVAKLFNLDEKIIWSFLTLIAKKFKKKKKKKKPLDEKGTLILIIIVGIVNECQETINYHQIGPRLYGRPAAWHLALDLVVVG